MAKRQDLTPEQIVASAPRPMAGNEAYRLSGTGSDFSHEQMRPRNLGGAGDPAYQPTGRGRNPVINENIGAAHNISQGLNRPVDPAAGPTMRNARIIPAKTSREGNFIAGTEV